MAARGCATRDVWGIVDDGTLVTTEGTLIDVDRIEADLRADCKRFQVQQVVWKQAQVEDLELSAVQHLQIAVVVAVVAPMRQQVQQVALDY